MEDAMAVSARLCILGPPGLFGNVHAFSLGQHVVVDGFEVLVFCVMFFEDVFFFLINSRSFLSFILLEFLTTAIVFRGGPVGDALLIFFVVFYA